MPRPHSRSPDAWRRPVLGGAALGLLLVGLLCHILVLRGMTGQAIVLRGACWKAGLVLSVFWLAWPQLVIIPGWLVAGSLVAITTLAVRPQLAFVAARMALVLAPILSVLWLLRPRKPKCPPA